MVAAQSQLSHQDGQRLAEFFAAGRSLLTLSGRCGIPLHDLIAWATLPHIHDALELLARLEDDAHRAAAIATLRHTIDHTDDLVEKRRAACAILRALRPPRTARASAGAAPPADHPPRRSPAHERNETTHPRQQASPPAAATKPPPLFRPVAPADLATLSPEDAQLLEQVSDIRARAIAAIAAASHPGPIAHQHNPSPANTTACPANRTAAPAPPAPDSPQPRQTRASPIPSG
jgi:hypothetical protein